MSNIAHYYSQCFFAFVFAFVIVIFCISGSVSAGRVSFCTLNRVCLDRVFEYDRGTEYTAVLWHWKEQQRPPETRQAVL